MKVKTSSKFLLHGLFLLPLFSSCQHITGDSEKAIHIAVVGSSSGESAADSKAIVRGINLCLDQINHQGGIDGKKVLLEMFDDQNDPVKAKEVALQIAQNNRTLAVLGHITSSCSISGGKIYSQYGIPAITSVSTDVDVTKGNEWFFRTLFNDDFQARFLANYIHSVFKQRNISIIYEDLTYGSSLAQVFVETANSLNMAVKFNQKFAVNDPDLDEKLSKIVTELKSTQDRGVIFLATHLTEGVKLVKLIRDANIQNQIIAPHAYSHKTFAQGFDTFPKERQNPGYYTNDIYVASPLLFDVATRDIQQFTLEYADRYGEQPGWPAAFAYDAAKIITKAIQESPAMDKATTIEDARKKVRDYLGSIRSPENAIPGASGLNYFDENGDAHKPISIGVYKGKTLVSALTQFQLVPNLAELSERRTEFDLQRSVKIDDSDFYQTSIVYAGIRAKEFDELDLKNMTFRLAFYIWFRYQGDIQIDNIEFLNAVEPITLGTPIDEVVSDGITYRAYEASGRFKVDFFDSPYGQHNLSVSFRHRDLTRNNLMYAVDIMGIGETGDLPLSERYRQAQKLISASTNWMIKNSWFFQDVAAVHPIGHPDFLMSPDKLIEFSRFNLGINIQRHSLNLRGLISGQTAKYVLWSSAFSILFLVFAGRHKKLQSSKTVWFLQMILAFLLLLSLETVVGNLVSEKTTRFYADAVDRIFDILWWFVPAILLNVAVERFAWQSLEKKTGQNVPTILRLFASLTIYLLAFFGVVAFVFDQRLTSLLATSGVIAMIIGLAVQINISNIFSGIALNMERPFRIGDWIQVHGRTPAPEHSIIGCVVDIGWRTTRLKTTGNCMVIIPNSVISEKTVTNFMAPDEVSRFEQLFYVDYSVPSEQVISVITDGIRAILGKERNGPLEKPEFKVRVNGTTPMGVEYEVRYYIIPRQVSPAKARHSINQSVLAHMKKAGITLAYPKREILRGTIETRS